MVRNLKLHIIVITMQHGMCCHGTMKNHLIVKICLLNVECGGGGQHAPYYDPSFSIRPLVLGPHSYI
jgi:hypothetical protein